MRNIKSLVNSFRFFLSVPLLITLFLALLTISCVPGATMSFYEPMAQGGRLVRAHCPPVHSMLLFEQHDVIVGVKAVKEFSTNPKENVREESGVKIMVTFEVPKGKNVSLLEQHVEMIMDSKAVSQWKLSGLVWTSQFKTKIISPSFPLIGKTEKSLFFDQVTLYGTTEHAYYLFSAIIEIIDIDSFKLKLPKFSVNNVDIELPIIEFKQSEERLIGAPLNC